MLCELSVQCRSHKHVTPTTAPVQGPPTLPTLPSSCRRSACTTGHHTALHGTSWPVGNALVCRPSGNGFDSLHGRRTVFIILLLLVVCLLLLLFCVFFVLFVVFLRSSVLQKLPTIIVCVGPLLGRCELTLVQSGWCL